MGSNSKSFPLPILKRKVSEGSFFPRHGVLLKKYIGAFVDNSGLLELGLADIHPNYFVEMRTEELSDLARATANINSEAPLLKQNIGNVKVSILPTVSIYRRVSLEVDTGRRHC